MKRFVLTIMLGMTSLVGGAADLTEIPLVETQEELQARKNSFLSIEAKDLQQYESIARQIDRDQTIGTTPAPEIEKIRTEFDSYVKRRLDMIRHAFMLFRNEYSRVTGFLEKVTPNRLPAFTTLIEILCDSLDAAKMKGSAEKWQDLKQRAEKLLTMVKTPELRQTYLDQLVLTADDSAAAVFEAKTRLLHRWLLEGRMAESRPWILDLEKKFGNHALCLALMSHYCLEEYKIRQGQPNPKELFEKNWKPISGVEVQIKVEDYLQKAFLYYLEALKRGYPEAKEIPGLLSEYLGKIRRMQQKIQSHWQFPTHFPGYREHMKEMASCCQAVVEFVPFKKYANPAFRLLSDIYTYWPTNAGAKIIDYPEIMRLQALVMKKKL
jgi:hypothetical protein